MPDSLETNCTGLGRDGRFFVDTDDDGFQDLAEALTGSDPCDPNSTVIDTGVDFFFVLPFQDPSQSDILRFDPTQPAGSRVDCRDRSNNGIEKDQAVVGKVPAD